MPVRMPLSDAQRARASVVLRRGLFALCALAGLLFLPSPSGTVPVMFFDTMLLSIFAMLVIGTTGPAILFVSACAFGFTVVLPVTLLTLVSIDDAGGVLNAFTRVIGVLTESNRWAGVCLVGPSVMTALLAAWLSKSRFRLPGY